MIEDGDSRLVGLLEDVCRLSRRLEFYAQDVGVDTFGDSHLGLALDGLAKSHEALEDLVSALEADPTYRSMIRQRRREATEREFRDYGM